MTPTRPAAALARALVLAAALAAAAPSAHAQFSPPPPDQPDLAIDARTRAAVLDTLIANLHARYVFPDVARTLDRHLRSLQRRGAFDGLAGAQAFADSLSAVLRAVGRDRHFRVHYRHEPLPRAAQDERPAPEELRRMEEQMRRTNWGFDRVQRLAGNVGLLEIRHLAPPTPEAGAALAAAMQFLSSTDALILDLRRNGGGSPAMVQLVCTYLFGSEDRRHLNDLLFREGGRESVEEFWTLPWVPGARYAGKPVHVLTSRRTGSGAEELAYNLRNLERATLVGDTTTGAANPGGFVRLHDHFVAFISNGRARSPVTGTNWEGTGVLPHVPVTPGEALRTAHVLSLEALIAAASDDERRAWLRRCLEQAQNAPAEPWEDPRRTRGL
uniref:Peptidase n=1 Tax=Eiseniibacteriota bacterium TaxID=2212470 RepID=A0A832I5L7_UNCEI